MANITIELTGAEQQALIELLDVALRQKGINALNAVSHFMQRIAVAQAAATHPAVPAATGTAQTAVPRQSESQEGEQPSSVH